MKLEITITYCEWIKEPFSKIQQATAERYVREMDESDNDAFIKISQEADQKKKEWGARLLKVRSDDFPFVQVYINEIK